MPESWQECFSNQFLFYFISFFVYLLIRLFLVLPHCVIILVVTKVIDVIFVDVAMFITTLLLMLQ